MVKRSDGALTLTWRWFSVRKLLGTCVSFVPLALLIDPTWRSLNLITVLIAVLAACGLYWAAALLINSTRVEVDRQRLRVAHGPVPWPGRKEVAVADVAQLYVGWEVYRAPRTGRRSYTFTLRAQLTRGGDEVLVGGPLDADRAKALEGVLERQLGLTNVPVTAEWSR